MSDNGKRSKKLMEPFLEKMAIRDKAITETKKKPKHKNGRDVPSTSRHNSERSDKRISNILDYPNIPNPSSVAKSNFQHIPKQLKIEVQTMLARDMKTTSNFKIGPSPTVMSVISEASIKSSISSISIKATFRSTHKMEDSPSYYQRLVIPFSGFTEDDVKEIRGGKEPKAILSANRMRYASMGTNEPRPVLKRYQSEKRRNSYDRYVKESFENVVPTRNTTEDSSYNTMIAVKMMVESNTKLGEIISSIITDEREANISKDTIFLINSEQMSLNLEEPNNADSSENLPSLNMANTSEQTHVSDSSFQRRLQCIQLQQDLEKVNTEYEQKQEEYDEAEKSYFTAKLHLLKVEKKRERLILQLIQLEEYLTKKS